MKRDAKTVSEWDFDRIIPCHGVCTDCIRLSETSFLTSTQDVIETGGKAAWDEVYKWYLVGKS